MPRDDAKDYRTLEQKLQAVAKPDSGASDTERAKALRALDQLHAVPAVRTKATRVVTREFVAASIDRDSNPRPVRVRYPDGRWYIIDEDMIDWDLINELRLEWHYDDTQGT